MNSPGNALRWLDVMIVKIEITSSGKKARQGDTKQNYLLREALIKEGKFFVTETVNNNIMRK